MLPASCHAMAVPSCRIAYQTDVDCWISWQQQSVGCLTFWYLSSDPSHPSPAVSIEHQLHVLSVLGLGASSSPAEQSLLKVKLPLGGAEVCTILLASLGTSGTLGRVSMGCSSKFQYLQVPVLRGSLKHKGCSAIPGGF